ncbi:MAG: hypothetical protein QM528_00570 [Phycisphaerales bacterium]|nr:hypothetical protein [Phycisphaerales bacterium]
MTTIKDKITVLQKLRSFYIESPPNWEIAKKRAFEHNKLFIPEFIEVAIQNIIKGYLDQEILLSFISQYPQLSKTKKNKIGVIVAGNIPLAGFYDFIILYLSDAPAQLKLSSKDTMLLTETFNQIQTWDPEISNRLFIVDRPQNCDAYITNGNNLSSNYFHYYFKKYPHILRTNKTSVAILTGNETMKELEQLTQDIFLYFGLGCRSVSKLFVPDGYNFTNFLQCCKRYQHLMDLSVYKNNYDYHLTLLLMDKKPYLETEALILTESKELFSPISQVYYTSYSSYTDLEKSLATNTHIQAIISKNHIPFGQAQCPSLFDFPDGIDIIKFIEQLQ